MCQQAKICTMTICSKKNSGGRNKGSRLVFNHFTTVSIRQLLYNMFLCKLPAYTALAAADLSWIQLNMLHTPSVIQRQCAFCFKMPVLYLSANNPTSNRAPEQPVRNTADCEGVNWVAFNLLTLRGYFWSSRFIHLISGIENWSNYVHLKTLRVLKCT